MSALVGFGGAELSQQLDHSADVDALIENDFAGDVADVRIVPGSSR